MRTKALALLAVFAMVFAGIAIMADGEDSDATSATVVSYNNASHVHVFLYSDDVIMIDTSKLDLGTNENVYVRIAGASTTDENRVCIGPIAGQERIYVDASGKDLAGSIDLIGAAGTSTKVALLGYDKEVIGAEVTLTVATAAATFKLDPDYATNGAAVAAFAVSESMSRSGTVDLSTSQAGASSGQLTRSGYTLVGWSNTASGEILLPATAGQNVEDLYMVAGSEVNNTTTFATLYAIWSANAHSVRLVTTAIDSIATATVSQLIQDTSGYGTLNITQTAAGSYKWILAWSAEDGTLGTTPTCTQLANGNYKFTNVTEDVVITITYSTWTDDQSGFSLTMDSVTNSTYGVAHASLDIYDYKQANTNTLSMSGVYYKAMDTNYRVYGSIANLVDADATWTANKNLGADISEGSDGLTAAGVLTLDGTTTQYDLKFTGGTGVYVYSMKATYTGASTFETPWAIYTYTA
jgi:hypothetical protein